MPVNESLDFSEPQPIYRSFGYLTDEYENRYTLVVTGPEEALYRYLEQAPIQLKILPRDAGEGGSTTEKEEATYPLPPGLEKAVAEDEQKEALLEEERPEEVSNALKIEMHVDQVTVDGPYDLHLSIDPHIGQGEKHFYYLYGASSAWANCSTAVGDADLYLAEQKPNGKWKRRDGSLRSGLQSDSVSADKRWGGNWRLKVYGFKDSTYTLSGVFSAGI